MSAPIGGNSNGNWLNSCLRASSSCLRVVYDRACGIGTGIDLLKKVGVEERLGTTGKICFKCVDYAMVACRIVKQISTDGVPQQREEYFENDARVFGELRVENCQDPEKLVAFKRAVDEALFRNPAHTAHLKEHYHRCFGK